MNLRARAEADKARRTDAIVAAGREIWSRGASSDFTMTDVARRAGIVKGTIYLYFPTKDDLLAAVSARILSDYLERIDRTLRTRKRWTLAQIASLFKDHVRIPAVAHNTTARARIAATARLIEDRVSRVPRGEAARFLVCAIAMLAGFAQPKRADFVFGVTALAHGMEKQR